MQCPQTNCLQWRLKARVKTDDYYMLVTRLISRNKHIFRPLLVQVSKRSLMLCAEEVNPKKRPIKNSRPDGSQSYQKREREKKKKTLEVMWVGRLSQFLLSKREMDAQGISYSTHEEWTDTTGQQILTTKKGGKKKHRERSKLHPFSPSARIYTYIYIWLCTYIYVYIQRLTPLNVKEGSQIVWRDGRFETEVPSTEDAKQWRGKWRGKRKREEQWREERVKDAAVTHSGGRNEREDRQSCAGAVIGNGMFFPGTSGTVRLRRRQQVRK